jgi:hypothetical protein
MVYTDNQEQNGYKFLKLGLIYNEYALGQHAEAWK